LQRKSVRLYYLEQSRPHVPLFAGPLVDWPEWYLRDSLQIEAALRWAQGDQAESRNNLRLADDLLKQFGRS
jgi:hypothetical protein